LGEKGSFGHFLILHGGAVSTALPFFYDRISLLHHRFHSSDMVGHSPCKIAVLAFALGVWHGQAQTNGTIFYAVSATLLNATCDTATISWSAVGTLQGYPVQIGAGTNVLGGGQSTTVVVARLLTWTPETYGFGCVGQTGGTATAMIYGTPCPGGHFIIHGRAIHPVLLRVRDGAGVIRPARRVMFYSTAATTTNGY